MLYRLDLVNGAPCLNVEVKTLEMQGSAAICAIRYYHNEGRYVHTLKSGPSM